MKKVLTLAAVLLLAGLSFAEEPKVYTEDDLKHYSNQPTADPERAFEELQRFQEQKSIDDANAEIAADRKRQRKYEEELLEIEWEKLRVEKDKADALQGVNIACSQPLILGGHCRSGRSSRNKSALTTRMQLSRPNRSASGITTRKH